MKYCLLILTLFVAACQMKMDLPPVHEVREISRVSKHANMHPIAFQTPNIDLPYDHLYAVYPFWDLSFSGADISIYDVCNSTMRHRFSNSEAFWARDKRELGDWGVESVEHVKNSLEKLGYDVVRPEKLSFDPYFELARAELLLNATITDLRMNICHLNSRWNGDDLHRDLGEAYVKVDWEIFDPLNKKIMGKWTTDGVGYLDYGVKKGQALIIATALENAAENLGRTQGFYDVVSGKSAAYPYPEKSKHSWLELEATRPLYNQNIQKEYNFIRRAIVLIRTSSGHGSGFFINDEGYALTNSHVVGNAKTVSIVDSNGTTFMADVIRTDERRDVALIKAPVTNNSYIPLQTKKFPKMLDKVYAVGAPLTEALKGTVSEGIISNFRKSSKSGLGMIQASVEIAPGSSGGPLLDKYGNVIGIAVQGYGQSATQYSRFIPIDDALDSLNLHLVKKPTFQ